jgi:hypothetical protein
MSLVPLEQEEEIQLLDSEEEGGGTGKDIPIVLCNDTSM